MKLAQEDYLSEMTAEFFDVVIDPLALIAVQSGFTPPSQLGSLSGFLAPKTFRFLAPVPVTRRTVMHNVASTNSQQLLFLELLQNSQQPDYPPTL